MDADEFVVNSHVAAGCDLVAYAEGTSDPDEQRKIESHLALCDACRAAVAELRSTLLLIEFSRLEPD